MKKKEQESENGEGSCVDTITETRYQIDKHEIILFQILTDLSGIF
jgi:hypothetical protein